MEQRVWKVGELAKRTGLTVRTLHHYDRIRLFSPSRITESGHRLYTEDDIVRLHRIVSLKELGFGLEEIRRLMYDSDEERWSEMLRLQVVRTEERMKEMEELHGRLIEILEMAEAGRQVSGEKVMAAIGIMKMMRDPFFKREQVEEWRSRFWAMGAASREKSCEEGKNLIDRFRRCKVEGKPPYDPEVVALAGAWKCEIEGLGPADGSLVRLAEAYYAANPEAAAPFGLNHDLYSYMKEAISYAE